MKRTSTMFLLATGSLLVLAGIGLGMRTRPSGPKAAPPASTAKVTKPAARWTHDFARAQATAQAGQKRVLINFTGSDWCGWCLRLRRELFARPEFIAYAGTNLVLVEVDFPRDNRQSRAQREANALVARRYGVTRVPTLALVDGDGRLLRTWGFEDGGARRYLAEFSKAGFEPATAVAPPATNAVLPAKSTVAKTSKKPVRATKKAKAKTKPAALRPQKH